jgi:RNA polymerase sigma-70 factor (ECF subfamily)
MGVALKYLKNTSAAEEITSKIFEELSNKLKKHTIEYFKPWLYRVTINEAFQLLRKKGQEISIEEFPHGIIDISDNDSHVKEQKIELLESALENLKPEQKQCIDFFYLQEKSYQQISEELNLPLMKVKSYIQNGKRNLKIQLEELNEFKNEK